MCVAPSWRREVRDTLILTLPIAGGLPMARVAEQHRLIDALNAAFTQSPQVRGYVLVEKASEVTDALELGGDEDETGTYHRGGATTAVLAAGLLVVGLVMVHRAHDRGRTAA